jgi:hypothetical protein
MIILNQGISKIEVKARFLGFATVFCLSLGLNISISRSEPSQLAEGPISPSILATTAAPPTFIEHSLAEGETLWFVSQLYYGAGAHFDEILMANNLKDVSQIRVGQRLKVPFPEYLPNQPGWEGRYASLLERRKKQEGLIENESPPHVGKAHTKENTTPNRSTAAALDSKANSQSKINPTVVVPEMVFEGPLEQPVQEIRKKSLNIKDLE